MWCFSPLSHTVFPAHKLDPLLICLSQRSFSKYNPGMFVWQTPFKPQSTSPVSPDGLLCEKRKFNSVLIRRFVSLWPCLEPLLSWFTQHWKYFLSCKCYENILRQQTAIPQGWEECAVRVKHAPHDESSWTRDCQLNRGARLRPATKALFIFRVNFALHLVYTGVHHMF